MDLSLSITALSSQINGFLSFFCSPNTNTRTDIKKVKTRRHIKDIKGRGDIQRTFFFCIMVLLQKKYTPTTAKQQFLFKK